MEWNDKCDVEHSFRRIEELLNCGIFDLPNATHPLLRSAFIEVLICLRDLMYKTEKHVRRIDFTDDVTISGRVTDVSSLIKYVRDALCHLDSDNLKLEAGNRASFMVQFGKGEMQINNLVMSNPYEDDICFFFGSQKIFLKRHIHRALEEARTALTPLLR